MKGEAEKYCYECGEAILCDAEICPHCAIRQPATAQIIGNERETDAEVRRQAGNKIAAGVCGILLGSLGVHKFILGMTKAGVIMLLVSIFGSCFFGFGPIVMHMIGIIEGVIYFTRSDEQFYRRYVVEKREWF